MTKEYTGSPVRDQKKRDFEAGWNAHYDSIISDRAPKSVEDAWRYYVNKT